MLSMDGDPLLATLSRRQPQHRAKKHIRDRVHGQRSMRKGPEDDLEAHRQLERGRRPSREDASLPKHVLGENEKHSGLIRKHRHLRILRARSHASRQPHRHYIMLSYYITYTMIYLARC